MSWMRIWQKEKPMKGTLRSLIAIIVWYAANVGILVTNKFLFAKMHFPIFLTLLHMLSCTIFSALILYSTSLVRRKIVSMRLILRKITVLCVAQCGSIVFGNASLQYLAISFNQMIGATTPLFTAILALIIARKVEKTRTYMSLVPIVIGIMMSVKGELNLHIIGAIYCITATALRAFKVVLQGILLTDDEERMDSLNLLFYVSPIASIALIPISIYFEENSPREIAKICAEPGGFRFVVIMVINLLLAFFVNLSNFLVTFHTSPLSLQVLGCLKGVLAAFFSWTIFGSPISSLGLFGYSVSISGVFMYTHSKLTHSPALPKTHSQIGILGYQSSVVKYPNDPYSASGPAMGAIAGTESTLVEMDTEEENFKPTRGDNKLRISPRPSNGSAEVNSQAKTSATDKGGLHYLHGRVPTTAINDAVTIAQS